jgi:hypothetical protein
VLHAAHNFANVQNYDYGVKENYLQLENDESAKRERHEQLCEFDDPVAKRVKLK